MVQYAGMSGEFGASTNRDDRARWVQEARNGRASDAGGSWERFDPAKPASAQTSRTAFRWGTVGTSV
jgi:hypothetical protein